MRRGLKRRNRQGTPNDFVTPLTRGHRDIAKLETILHLCNRKG
jgi:hypothetical protein